jgi:xanthine dehydrogenase YagR molybdenum-binding subunit
MTLFDYARAEGAAAAVEQVAAAPGAAFLAGGTGLLDLMKLYVEKHDLEKYVVPVNADVPAIDVVIVPEVDPHTNAIGIKGIGEVGNVGSAAAVANAVFHATGRRVPEFPSTPERLL